MKDKSNTDFDLARFRTMVDAYGADSSRWPGEEREQALAFARRTPEAAKILQEAARLDRLLDEAPALEPSAALLRAIADIPERHESAPAFDAGAAPGREAAFDTGAVSGWSVYRPFDAPWKPALAAAFACALGVITGVATVEPYGDGPYREAPVAEASVTYAADTDETDTDALSADAEEEAYFEDLSSLAFASDVDDVFAALTSASNSNQEPQP